VFKFGGKNVGGVSMGGENVGGVNMVHRRKTIDSLRRGH